MFFLVGDVGLLLGDGIFLIEGGEGGMGQGLLVKWKLGAIFEVGGGGKKLNVLCEKRR